MADLMGMLNSGTADAATNTVYTMMKWLGILLIIALIFWFIWNKKQYKFKVKLKVLGNAQFVYYESTARIKKIDGAPFWFIKGLKELVTVPPAESMYLGSDGRWVAEGYYERTAGIIWSRDVLSKQEFAKLALEIAHKRTTKESGQESVETHYQPMTSTERSLQANQVTKAILRKGKDIWAMIWQILPVVILLVLFALVLIFWKDIAQPVITLANTNAEISKNNAFMQQQNIRLYQMLTGGKGNGTNYIVQQLPSDQQYFMPQFPGGNTS